MGLVNSSEIDKFLGESCKETCLEFFLKWMRTLRGRGGNGKILGNAMRARM